MVKLFPRLLLAMVFLVRVASGQTFTNGSFETGDFTGWQVKGVPSIATPDIHPPTPVDGTQEALINSTGASGPGVFAGTNSVTAADLETFLNTTLPPTAKGPAFNGEAIQQTFSTPAGGTITFSYAFATREQSNNAFDETGYVLNGVFHILADPTTPGLINPNDGRFLTLGLPYRTITITVGPGVNTLGFVAYNTLNGSAPSGLYLDNIVVTPFPPVNTAIHPPGGISSQAMGISGNNVVGSFMDTNSVQYGFLNNGTTTSTVDPFGTTSNTVATGVSGTNVVGWYSDGALQHGYLYDGTAYTSLDPAGSTGTQATAVSGSNVVGWYVDGSSVQRGFFYDGTTYTPVQPFSSGQTQATGVSGTNVVGWYVDSGSAQRGFFFDGTTYTQVGPTGSTSSQATGVSGTNVVGWYFDSNATPVQHGFLFDGTNYTTIDPAGSIDTVVTGISGSNLVGWYKDSGGVQHGFLSDGLTYTTIDPTGSTGTQITSVSGTSFAGSYADSNQVQHAFVGVFQPAGAVVTLDTFYTTYNAAPQSPTAVTSPGGLAVDYTYDGSATEPFAAGTYTVAATVDDPNYQGSASATMVISPAAATVALSNLTQTYDGTPKPATATTTPVGVGVSVTYTDSSNNTSSTPPTAAGTYTVTCAIDDPNYTGDSDIETLTINQATATVVLGSLTQTYDGTPKPASVTTTPSGLNVTYTYTDSSSNVSSTPPTNAGTYTVTATVNDPNYTGSDTEPLTISPGTANVALINLNPTYNGTPESAGANTTPAGLNVTYTYTDSNNNVSSTPPTVAGTYTVTATINDPNYQGSASSSFVIAKATASVVLGNLTPTYDGTAKPASVSTTPGGLAVVLTYKDSSNNISSTPPTNAGSYLVTGLINDPNYQGSDSETLTIAQATATVALSNLNQVYDGTPKSATATTTPVGLTVTFTYKDSDNNVSASPPSAVGTYVVTGTISDANYQGNDSETFSIAQANATVALSDLNQTYDGTPKPVSATTTPVGLTVTFTYEDSSNNISSTPPTNAGTYRVIGTINDPNYAGQSNGMLTIAQATATVMLSNLTPTYDGTPKSAVATTTPNGLTVTLAYTDSGNNVNATPPTNAGNYTVTGTVSDTNYQGNNSAPFVIGKATATVVLSNLNPTYDGTPKSATATTTPTGLTVTFSYEDSSSNVSATPPTEAGAYTVTATVNDTNYAGSASSPFVIGTGGTRFSDWEMSYNITGGPSDTPENDGVPNMLKYLFDIDPTRPMTAADRAALPSLGTTTVDGVDYLTLTYRQYSQQTGITITLQSSTDMKTWSPHQPPDFSQTLATDPATGDTTVEVGVEANASGPQFLRLQVTMP